MTSSPFDSVFLAFLLFNMLYLLNVSRYFVQLQFWRRERQGRRPLVAEFMLGSQFCLIAVSLDLAAAWQRAGASVTGLFSTANTLVWLLIVVHLQAYLLAVIIEDRQRHYWELEGSDRPRPATPPFSSFIFSLILGLLAIFTNAFSILPLLAGAISP